MRAVTRAFSVLFCAVASSACMELPDGATTTGEEDPKAPGEVLGFFAVDGKLSGDSCGAESLSAPEAWSFEVKLSRDGSTLYWLNGREAIVGEIDKANAFAFQTHLELKLSEPRGAFKGCTIVRSDSARGTLTASQSSLSAKLTYGYSVKSGSNCEGDAAGGDGMPAALPCQLSYALSGARVQE